MIRKSKKNQKDGQGALFEFAEAEIPKPYTIGAYLNFLNGEFKRYKARVMGEISSLDIRDTYLFFSLKDKNGEGLLSCFMWRRNYDIAGVDLEVGMEIIVDGHPEIYAPSGRFNFRVSMVELVGEGALKKAYEELKKKLEREGVFVAEKYFENKDIDALVVIRGGGSLESLQAFNNEALVRKIAGFGAPVICGIGHDKDIPLASLAADIAVSTPTAVTTILNRSWEKVVNDILSSGKDVLYKYQSALGEAVRDVDSFSPDLIRVLESELENKSQMLDDASRRLQILDPARQLKLGYSIVYAGGKVMKTVKSAKTGEELRIMVSDGNISTTIKNINK